MHDVWSETSLFRPLFACCALSCEIQHDAMRICKDAISIKGKVSYLAEIWFLSDMRRNLLNKMLSQCPAPCVINLLTQPVSLSVVGSVRRYKLPMIATYEAESVFSWRRSARSQGQLRAGESSWPPSGSVRCSLTLLWIGFNINFYYGSNFISSAATQEEGVNRAAATNLIKWHQ